jgi:HD-GYP domain-containing protein (c-di-GMP phosphodiesterase class II)
VLADAADLDANEQHDVERIALFHDVGKIHEALFDIIHEDSKLTPEERDAVRTHPARGADVLTPLAAFYPELAAGVLAHHERWDGSGYPNSLAGDDIPLTARVVSIADAFDAITFSRRYRSAASAESAAEKLMSGRGTQFDPDLVDLFLSPPVFERIMAIQSEDEGPRPRRALRKAPPDSPQLPALSFRWRTTTPAPRASRQALHRSP